MQRIVCDTNVYISAYNFGGTARKVLLQIQNGEGVLYTSPPLLKEIEEILVRKFKRPRTEVEAILRNIESYTSLVMPKTRLRVVTADPDDDRIIECAVAANADMIISGDNDLLSMKRFKNISILSLREFLDLSNLKRAA